MSNSKKQEPVARVLYSFILFVVVLCTTLFAAFCFPGEMLIIGALFLLTAASFGLFGYFVAKYVSEVLKQKDEEYNSILKSEKASYLLLKKSFDEIYNRMTTIEVHTKDPMTEVINAQKAIAKVSINRSKENADAIMNANEKVLELVFDISDRVDNLSNEVKKTDTTADVKDIIERQRIIEREIKEVELGIRNQILEMSTRIQAMQQIPPQVVMAPLPQMQTPPPVAPMGMGMMGSEPAPRMQMNDEPVPELPNDLGNMDLGALDGGAMSSFAVDTDQLAGGIPELGDLSADAQLPPIDAEPETTAEPEAVAEPEPIAEPEPVVEPEPVAEPEPAADLPPMPDLSDPNHVMSPDEIAALMANMNAGGAAAEPEPVVEPEPEPAADLPPMPDLSDPNHVMSPDEIAALMANMNAGGEAAAEPEPVVEPEPEPAADLPPMPDLSDPNHVMSPDEIAALMANMNAGGDVASEPEPVAEPEPEPEPAVDLPPMPDLSDPNRSMSPEEIAALFANLG